MKLRKLLTPILSVVGTAAIATPLVCLTSCAGDIEERAFFNKTFNEDAKEVDVKSTYVSTYDFEFSLATGVEKPTVEPRVVIKSESSNINIVQCTGEWTDNDKYTVHIDMWTKRGVVGDYETTFNLQLLCTVGEGSNQKTYQQFENGFKFYISAN